MPLREPSIISDPAIEPVTVQQFKDWARIDISDEDGTVAPSVLAAARILFERETGTTVFDTTYEYYLEGFPVDDRPIRLPRASPLIEVVEIAYQPETGSEITWSSSNWYASARTKPGRVCPASGLSYPTESLAPLDPIRIRYRAGIEIDSPQTYPNENVLVTIKQIALSMFELREADVSVQLGKIQVNQLSWVAQRLLGSSVTYYFG